jgi:hypothetical protein
MSNKLFVYNRSLPAPFDKIPKTAKGVSSKYGDGTDAKLCATTVKAVLAYGKIAQGDSLGALGQVGGKTVLEYKSAVGNEYHLAVHDPVNGDFVVGVFDTGTLVMQQYTVGNKARDGAALMLALFPALMQDEEFRENLEIFSREQQFGFPDPDAAANTLALLCDNAYRRVSDDSCPAHVKAKVDTAGNITRISKTHLDSRTFEPQTVLTGEFSVLADASAATVYTPAAEIPHGDFVGKYKLNSGRALTAREQKLIPDLEPWYILPDEIVSVCKHMQATTGRAAPMRNVLLRGPAGTGKTKGAMAIAAGLGLPYVKFTCSANTEVFDFIGQVFPDTAGASTGDAELDAQRKALLELGGVTYENVAQLLHLPGLDDMDYDPAGVYAKVTGVAKPDASAQDCMQVILGLVTDKVRELSAVKTDNTAGQTYIYTDTDFLRALKHGWVCEIQEPTCIMQPGVLVGLNSLLEQSGSVTLPTGEVIKRHPDAVVVITTNTSYEGCRGMNQSVLDRMNLAIDVEQPPEPVMVQRAMSVTDCEDDVTVSQMVKVVAAMAEYCRHNQIEDGAVGTRSLIDWIISWEITGDVYASALYTVVSKASANEEDRAALIANCLEPYFTRAHRAAA